MTTTEKTAPDLTPGYPSNGAKLGPAWQAMWDALKRSDDFQDGRTLAEEIAPQHGLDPATLIALFSRMAHGGYLDRELRPVVGTRGNRKRSHYRIGSGETVNRPAQAQRWLDKQAS